MYLYNTIHNTVLFNTLYLYCATLAHSECVIEKGKGRFVVHERKDHWITRKDHEQGKVHGHEVGEGSFLACVLGFRYAI